jgi:ribonucleoside-diphosphate reductase alpha chain
VLKRPKELPADLHVVTVKGIKYGVIVGKLQGRPFEVFAFNLPPEIKEACSGKVIKIKKGHYNFVCEDGRLQNIQEAAIHSDEMVLTRLVSGLLRHGAKVEYVLDQIDKAELEVVSFGKAVYRTLKKYASEDEMLKKASCKSCGSTNLRMQEGCLTCLSCGNSKCG